MAAGDRRPSGPVSGCFRARDGCISMWLHGSPHPPRPRLQGIKMQAAQNGIGSGRTSGPCKGEGVIVGFGWTGVGVDERVGRVSRGSIGALWVCGRGSGLSQPSWSWPCRSLAARLMGPSLAGAIGSWVSGNVLIAAALAAGRCRSASYPTLLGTVLERTISCAGFNRENGSGRSGWRVTTRPCGR